MHGTLSHDRQTGIWAQTKAPSDIFLASSNRRSLSRGMTGSNVRELNNDFDVIASSLQCLFEILRFFPAA
jgi:hypothetical protein